MSKIIEIIKHVLLYIWQLPQNIIGLCIIFFIQGETKHKLHNITYYYYDPFPGGISLGNYIIVGSQWAETIKHEFGHTLQSLYLGPLYLLVIGLPSIIWAGLYGTLIKDTENGYYKFYTEKWANKLGKVKR